ncbi:hypothetical protein F4778DRAFT_148818 [Xylariomycetidae sp. FL2044]|nr:hypothetical protein F4778DRAFT_148818 [Xylariomycetidae sp. FL2044]
MTATTVLGKRKSRAATTRSEEPSISHEEAQAIFARHFESQFAPLSPPSTAVSVGNASAPHETEDLRSSDSENEEDGSWDGFSGDEEYEQQQQQQNGEEPTAVEIITHASLPSRTAPETALSKRESRVYLSSRVPSSSTTTTTTTVTSTSRKTKPTTTEEDAPSLLKNDLALRRLLSESHLLQKPGSTGTGTGTGTVVVGEHTGRNRHLASDLRMASLGSRESVYAQARMPMAMRKGIEGARARREDKRRREARENGVVLERPSSTTSVSVGAGKKKKMTMSKNGNHQGRGGGGGGGNIPRKRELDVGAPAVGRMRNGMLKLSRRDIAEIQGDGGGSGGRGGKGGKKRRR